LRLGLHIKIAIPIVISIISEYPTPNLIFAPLISGPGQLIRNLVRIEVSPSPNVKDFIVIGKDNVVTSKVLIGSLLLELLQVYEVVLLPT